MIITVYWIGAVTRSNVVGLLLHRCHRVAIHLSLGSCSFILSTGSKCGGEDSWPDGTGL